MKVKSFTKEDIMRSYSFERIFWIYSFNLIGKNWLSKYLKMFDKNGRNLNKYGVLSNKVLVVSRNNLY